MFLIAVGAILKFAINDRVKDVDLSAVGVILMIVGAVGLLLSLLWLSRADRPLIRRDRYVERDVPPRL